MSHILVVDDDLQLCELLTEVLQEEGYQVHCVNDGESALNYMQTLRVDLVLLDVMLPHIDGLQVARRICQRFATPILMLTALGGEKSMLEGLQAGADQYLVKPFAVTELFARITSLLRRVALEKQRFTLRDCSDSFSIKFSGLPLTETEKQLMQFLIKRDGETVSKATLQKEVLKKDISAFDRNLDMHISNIRRKMLHAGLSKLHIKTVHGKGYLFSENVS
ncbi:response regulator transcription factor [Psychromonas sp. Urea-02u-13]|uniref:response regulator transcription factor n=1 Tax=Psychromonas sp. Urea-02u-13 TaxID=2058326 RepID=UPI000C33F76F|nr:response regulator transcription factor [Psychromonas sp. Urea-02u-13]PKG38456.1 DNA-binding response regulator [Psychromonas sp. Urea-02u-13]